MIWLIFLIAYLIGGIPVGLLLVKWKTGRDVRSSGSGNIGATNVQRVAGLTAGIATLVLDAAKGYLAVWLAYRVSGGSIEWASAAAVCVLLGHVFTPFLRFEGGKGVATFFGAFLFLAPGAVAAIVIVFLTVVAFSRVISLGSILGALTFPLAVWLIVLPGWPLLAAAVFACALVLYRHKGNLERIRAGTEHRFVLGNRHA